MRFDFADLRLFRHVVEAGSITHGAERANLALAAASTRIRNMEEALGAPLFTRTGRSATLNEAGEEAVEMARQIVGLFDELAVRVTSRELRGTVRMGAIQTAQVGMLPEALGILRDRHPLGSGRVGPGSSLVPIGQGGSGELDAALMDPPPLLGRLKRFPFRRDRFVLVVPDRHPLAKRHTVSFEEILDHDFVGLERQSAAQRFFADKAAKLGRTLRLRVQLRSFETVCRVVEFNVGVGIVPRSSALRAVKTMAIRVVDIADAWAVRDLPICVRNLDGR